MTDRSEFKQSVRTSFRHPVVRFSVSVLLALIFLYLAFRGIDLNKLLASLAGGNYWWLLVSFCIMLSSHLVRAWRWRFLLDPLKPGIGLRNLFSGVIVGYFMNNLFPRAGELARPYTIAKLEKVPASAALGTVVVERIMDTMAFVLLVFAIPLVYTGPLLESFPWLRSAGWIVLLITVPLMVLPLVLMVRRDWTDRLLGFASRLLPANWERRLRMIVHAFLDGFLFVKRPVVAIEILLITGVIWGLYLASMYAAFFGFGLQSQLGLGAGWVTLAISSIGVAIPTPGSTGTYHAFTSQTLTRLFHVDGAVALSYATATHAVNFIGVTIIGLYFFLKDNVSLTEAVKGVPKEDS